MVRFTALGAIDAYRRYISPYKGYGCAYRIHWGSQSCSRYAQRAIARAGVWRGLLLVRRRLHACADAAILSTTNPEKQGAERIFGSCNPAVQEGRKLCCGSLIGGLTQMGGR